MSKKKSIFKKNKYKATWKESTGSEEPKVTIKVSITHLVLDVNVKLENV